MSNAAETLRREIEALHSAGTDPARLRDLQAQYRSLGVVETRHLDPDGKVIRITHGNPADGVTRISPIVVRGGAGLAPTVRPVFGRVRSSSAPTLEPWRPPAGPELRSTPSPIRVVMSRFAREQMGTLGYGHGAEICAGLFGDIAGGEIYITRRHSGESRRLIFRPRFQHRVD